MFMKGYVYILENNEKCPLPSIQENSSPYMGTNTITLDNDNYLN